MRVNENEMLKLIGFAKNIALVEPDYKRKYPPLGLAKIATYAKQMGSNTIFRRGHYGKSNMFDDCPQVDLICITSLFTYDIEFVKSAIRVSHLYNKKTPILVGGVCASLMPKEVDFRKDYDLKIFTGCSEVLDKCVPDYTKDWGVEKPWDEYSFTFTSRGCPNKCAYCAVWRIEPKQGIVPNWKQHIVPDKKFAMISDNNLSACSEQHITEVIRFLRDNNKKVVFDNGLDCKHITKEMAKELATLKYARTGLRLAFDRIEEDGVFQNAIELLKSAGVAKSNIMAYCLFNFKDTYQEANYRMSECVKLGIRPYPQQYQPLIWKDRKKKYIGKHWTPNLLRTFRFFWLMAGYYTKTTFEEFIDGQEKYKLSEKDYESIVACPTRTAPI